MNVPISSIYRDRALARYAMGQSAPITLKPMSTRFLGWLWAALGLIVAGGLAVGLILFRMLRHV